MDCAAELVGKLGSVRRRSRPVVACPRQAWWVEPELYCRVRCQGWTSQGRMRHGIFRGLLENQG